MKDTGGESAEWLKNRGAEIRSPSSMRFRERKKFTGRLGERTVWRITLPDGKPLAIVINGTRAVGLQARLTDEMIEVKKEERAAKAKAKPML
jgi:hypothetical protein